MARKIKSPGTTGSPVAINQPNMIMLESEDSKVSQVGSWSSVEDNEAVGASYLRNNTTGNKLTFSFKGSALWIRFRFGADCGKASITIDDTSHPDIDLYNALDLYKYVNVAVGLDENASHSVEIAVAGTKNASSTDYYVNVDAFVYRTTEEALSLQNIEYIDLINVINTINKINEIILISNIANISVIQKIADAPWIANMGIAINGDFETGNLVGWTDPAGVATVTDAHPHLLAGSKYSCNLKHSSYGIIQFFSPPKALEDIVEFSIDMLAESPATEQLHITFFLTDGGSFSFDVKRAKIANTWYSRDIYTEIQNQLQPSPSLRRKHFYAIQFRNSGTTDGFYIDKVILLALPTELRERPATLNDVEVTVAAGASGETANAGTVPVMLGQVFGVSLEYKSSHILTEEDTSFEVRVTLRNSDETVNETLSFTPPEKPSSTDWWKYNFFLVVPSGVSYAGVHGYFNNAEVGERTVYMRNIKVFPVPPRLDAEGNLSKINAISTIGGTAGGTNIVIDKLTQEAYTSRGAILSNNGASATMRDGNLTTRRGKFFPRGCRGWIRYVHLYVDNADTASHTITVKIAQYPGGPVLIIKTDTLVAGYSAWKSVSVDTFWPYDSMFIYFRSDSDTYGRIGYDTGEPYDRFDSADEVVWDEMASRLWIRLDVWGAVGDVTVAGTVTIPKFPREDLTVYSEDVAATGAGDTEIVAASANQKIKVYAFGYESDADVVHQLRFGTGTKKFGRRTTKGVYAQTFVHPLVGDFNEALNFRAEGAVNAKVWVAYVKE